MKKQVLSLQSLPNLREMDKYKNKDGRSIRSGKLFRSENLVHASSDDKKILFSPNGLNIKTIIDLRSTREIALSPYSLQNIDVNYCNIDVSDIDFMHEINFANGLEKFLNSYTFEELQEVIKNMYRQYVSSEHCRLALKKVFETILNSGERPLLYHCVSGKDRTGLITVMIMMMLEFTPKDIKKEYLLTNIRRLDYNLKKFDNIRKDNKNPDYMRKYQYMTLVNPNNLEAFLSEIYKAFGTPQAYFDSIGMNKENIIKLKELLLA